MDILFLYLPITHAGPEAKSGELIGCQGWEPVGLLREKIPCILSALLQNGSFSETMDYICENLGTEILLNFIPSLHVSLFCSLVLRRLSLDIK